MKKLGLFIYLCSFSMNLFGVEKSLVRVKAFSQPLDERSPWSQLPIKESHFVGVLVSPKEILISAQAVHAVQYLEVESLLSSKTYRAEVFRVDYNAQLALLRIEKSIKGTTPFPLGEDIPLNKSAKILTLRQKRVVPIKTTFRELKVRSSITAPYNLPHYAFEVKRRGVGWSEPVARDGRLVGLSVRKEQNQIFALPISVLKRFLESPQEKVSSFGRLGIRYDRLRSEALRKLLGAPKLDQGVWVSEVSPRSTFDKKVNVGDVLLKVGRYQISDEGKIIDPLWGVIPLSGVVYRYPVGETITIQLIRDKKVIEVKETMKVYDSTKDMIPHYGDGTRRFVIYGGLVIQELSRNYLQSYGKSWSSRAPLLLLKRYVFGRAGGNNPKRRVIILSKVLVDDINKGYESIKNSEVVSINGKKIDDFDDLTKALGVPVSKNGRTYTTINLGPRHKELVLDHELINDSHSRISRNYAVPSKAFWSKEASHQDASVTPED